MSIDTRTMFNRATDCVPRTFCQACEGDKDCLLCLGDKRCKRCKGKGECLKCDGTGKIGQ